MSAACASQLTLWPEVSPARTSALRARARESRAIAPGSGARCTGSSESADPDGCWWRTSLLCAIEALTGCSGCWRWQATPAGRSWWVLGPSERPIGGTAPGSLDGVWPTPTATAYGSNGNSPGETGPRRPSLQGMAWMTPQTVDSKLTPRPFRPKVDRQTRDPNMPGSYRGDLADQVAASWPTPRSEDSEQTGAHAGTPDTLTSAARTWPTPQANDDKGLGENTPGHSPQLRHCPTLLAGLQDPESRKETGRPRGSLNSRWVAQLMGYPPDWCDLPTETPSALSATASSRKSRS